MHKRFRHRLEALFVCPAVGRPFCDRYGFREVGRYRREASGEMTFKMELPGNA